MNLQKFIAFLETYKGRDRILRLLSYASKLGAEVSPQLDSLSRQLSTSRAAFRLLDDLPTLVSAFQYGLGKKEDDGKQRFLNVLGSVVDVIFCPVDHISWAIDHGIIVSKSTLADTLNTALWVTALYINIMSSLLKLSVVLDKKGELIDRGKKDSSEMKALTETQKNLTLSTVRMSLDILFAVNYLPPGILWSRSLTKWQVGVLGTISSLIALYQSLK